ncbi:uncharacterized protein LOC112503869 [Cynara cardunculus var. scolymus]|uniref:uncharacterized protein LOC112503869 n=1 Tax=Cynara cardunculus var. scolymus TaxID=59895 RepID=UPI000D62B111|nr:uncharacterized protein LOC112503869 [Cynara cardunculus var. scolymus]
MKVSLDSLIDKAQSAFIPGRRITDNILMAHELVSRYQLSNGPPRCAFKIDIKKAYDTVDWRFLVVMLEGLGFHPVLVKWIREMVSTTSYSLSFNGNSYGFFHGGRGLRQGDPLSPYLFTIVMEGFSMLLKQCILEAAEFGYHRGCEELELTHLCFVDDLFVFTKGDVISVEVLKKALFLFQCRSGLAPSLEKIEIYFGNVPCNIKEAILECLPFKLGSFPVRYLGVPLSQARLKLCDYAPLIAKAPKDDLRGRCRLSWDVVCRSLAAGGLDIKRLSIWNRALLAKHVWDVVRHRDSLWVSWIYGQYLRSSHFWMIGDGRATNAWEDNWLSCGHVSAFISYRFVHSCGFSTSTTFRDLLLNWDGIWPDDWSSRFAELQSSPLPLLNDSVHDKVLWSEDRNSAANFLGRLPTQDRMIWKDEPPDLECSLCRQCMDSHFHLFFQCPYAREVWDSILHVMALTDMPSTWDLFMETISDSNRCPKRLKQKLAVAASVYYIWQERNRRLFTGESRTSLQLVKVIDDAISMRVDWLSRKPVRSFL